MEIFSRGGQISGENLYYIQYYKEGCMSSNKLFNISDGYVLHCDINLFSELMERMDGLD
jgi:hypothetical protein